MNLVRKNLNIVQDNEALCDPCLSHCCCQYLVKRSEFILHESNGEQTPKSIREMFRRNIRRTNDVIHVKNTY